MTMETRLINYLSIAIGGAVGIFTGWYIYRKTMARARQMELEEANRARDSTQRRSTSPRRRFSDEPEAPEADGVLDEQEVDDDLDYFDEETGTGSGGYRDRADPDDIFVEGDGADITPPINLRTQHK